MATKTKTGAKGKTAKKPAAPKAKAKPAAKTTAPLAGGLGRTTKGRGSR